MNYCGFNTEPFCSDAWGDHRRPQTLAEICRNMGICCSFRAVAARGKYPGFILLETEIFIYRMTIGTTDNKSYSNKTHIWKKHLQRCINRISRSIYFLTYSWLIKYIWHHCDFSLLVGSAYLRAFSTDSNAPLVAHQASLAQQISLQNLPPTTPAVYPPEQPGPFPPGQKQPFPPGSAQPQAGGSGQQQPYAHPYPGPQPQASAGADPMVSPSRCALPSYGAYPPMGATASAAPGQMVPQPDVSTVEPHYNTLWRHDERDSVSNHRRFDCLLNRLFRPRPKEISKLRVTGLCGGNSPVTGEFPLQRACNAENVFIWWCHHVSKI